MAGETSKLRAKSFPLIVWGMALLLGLPVIIAAIDVSLGAQTSFVSRLTLWNEPWSYIGGITVFIALFDMRRSGHKLSNVGKFYVFTTLFLLVLSIVLSRTNSAIAASADLHLIRIFLAVSLGYFSYLGMLNYQNKFAQGIYFGLILSVLLLIPFVLFFLFFQEESRALGKALMWRVPGFGPVRLFGVFVEVGIAVGIGLLILQNSKKRNGFLWVALVIMWCMLFWSGSRGAFFSLVLSISLGSIIFHQHFLKFWTIFLISAVIGALLSLLIWVPEGSTFGLKNMLMSSMREDINSISAGRLERWLATIDLIKERPFFGYGLSQFSYIWNGFNNIDESRGITGTLPLYFLSYRHVHNIVLEAGLSWGIVGAVLFFGMMIKVWFKAFALVRVERVGLRLPAFLALNALLFHANFTGIYIFPHSLFYVAIFFGICLAPFTAQNKNTSR